MSYNFLTINLNIYITFVTTALLIPFKSKFLKCKSILIGLSPPCIISIVFMRSGSNGGIDKPGWPLGFSEMIFVIASGKHLVSPAWHCGRSAAEEKN